MSKRNRHVKHYDPFYANWTKLVFAVMALTFVIASMLKYF